jgi:hypothetical protein
MKHDRDINAAINIKKIGLTQYCKNKTGKPLPEEPVELPTLVGTVKRECKKDGLVHYCI